MFFPFRLQYVQEFYTIEFQTFGGILSDTFWRHLGGILELLGGSGGHLEGILAGILGHLGASWEHLGSILGHLGDILGPTCPLRAYKRNPPASSGMQSGTTPLRTSPHLIRSHIQRPASPRALPVIRQPPVRANGEPLPSPRRPPFS